MSGIGMGLGALGSFMGAQSQNKAAKAQLNAQYAESDAARRRLGVSMFGLNDYGNYLGATNDNYGLALQGLPQVAWNGAAQKAAASAWEAKHPPLIQAITDAGQRYVSDLEGNQRQEQGWTDQLDRLATQNEQAGQDLTADEIARIKRDSARSLANTNRVTGTRLGLLGMSTFQPNQIAANQRLSNEQENDAILRAKQEALGRFQAARQARIGLMASRQALEGELGRTIAGARQAAAVAPGQATLAGLGMPAFGIQQIGQGAGQSALGSALGSIAGGLTSLGVAGLYAGGNNRGGGGGGGGGGPSPGGMLGGQGSVFGAGFYSPGLKIQ